MTRTAAGTTALIVWLTGCSTAPDEGSNTDSTSEETTQQTNGVATSTGGASTSKSPTSGNTRQSSSPNTTGTGSSTRPNTTSGGSPQGSGDDVDTADLTSNTTSTDDTQSEQSVSSDGDTTEATDTTAGPTSEGDGSDETSTSETTEPPDDDVVDVGADDKFSFFVTSYYHLALLSGSEEGFGGDLRYGGAATGLEGADAICQEIARRVSFGNRTWRAYLSTSTENAIDRIGEGPWYDFVGALVADSKAALTSGEDRFPGGCCEEGTYDEMGLFHDGSTDQNNDGIDDDDHDTMTSTQEDGTYSGFSCEDWTSTTATAPASGGGGQGGGQGGGGQGGGGGPGRGGGIMMGHSWPAQSGQHWATSHGGHNCAAGTNFIQNGAGDSSSVGGGGGYGGFYCFALPE